MGTEGSEEGVREFPRGGRTLRHPAGRAASPFDVERSRNLNRRDGTEKRQAEDTLLILPLALTFRSTTSLWRGLSSSETGCRTLLLLLLMMIG